jgi:hypothetical protein
MMAEQARLITVGRASCAVVISRFAASWLQDGQTGGTPNWKAEQAATLLMCLLYVIHVSHLGNSRSILISNQRY